MDPKVSPKKRTPKFDVEITVSSALIGLSNLIFQDPAVQGICSLLSPAVAHYSTIIVGNAYSDFKINKQQKKFETRIKTVIAERLDERETATDDRRKELDIEISKLRKLLSESQLDILKVGRPDLGKD